MSQLDIIQRLQTDIHIGKIRFNIGQIAEHVQQTPLRDRLDDQPISLAAHHGLPPFQLEFARDAHCLIASVAEQTNMTFSGVHNQVTLTK